MNSNSLEKTDPKTIFTLTTLKKGRNVILSNLDMNKIVIDETT